MRYAIWTCVKVEMLIMVTGEWFIPSKSFKESTDNLNECFITEIWSEIST